MSNSKRKVGHPFDFPPIVRQHIAELVAEFGLTGARKRLNAPNRTKLSKERNKEIVPEPLGISMPTLGKIKREYGVTVRMGRRKAN